MALFQNKYRVESARLQNWDYASAGCYYITVCTRNRVCYFGSITDGIMELSAIGAVARKCWQDISNHFPFVQLDAFVIMPNHIHGIIIIDKPDKNVETQNLASLRNASQQNASPIPSETQNLASLRNASQQNASPIPSETQNLASLRDNPKNKFGPQSKNIASIIRGFKIGVTKFAHTEKLPFAWQSRFYDHIVRDENDLNRIRRYILNNPVEWAEDDL